MGGKKIRTLCKHDKEKCKDCCIGYCPPPCSKRTDQCIEHNINLRCDCVPFKIRSRCIICTPSAACPDHPNVLKALCTQCDKRSCTHKKRKDECIECTPLAFCQHKKVKRKCAQCKREKEAEVQNK